MPLKFHPFTSAKETNRIVLPQNNSFYLPKKEKIIIKKDQNGS